MTNSSQDDLDIKLSAIRNLAIKAHKHTDELDKQGNGTDNSEKEKKEIEGAQNDHERLIDDLKTAVESLITAVDEIDTRSKNLENDRKEQFIEMRETYASKAYHFVWLWSIALISIIILDGSKVPTLKIWFLEIDAHDFKLDPKIMIALISGVTVNIVAVFIVVIRNLFPSEIKEQAASKKI